MKYIKHIGVFLAVFLIAVLLLFPYESVITMGINTAITQQKLPVRYTTLEAGAFGTTMRGVQVNDITISTIALSYSPLSLITRSAHLSASAGLFTLEADMKGESFTYSGTLNIGNIARMFEQTAKGKAEFQGIYDLGTFTGEMDITASDVTAKTPLKEATIKKVQGKLAFQKNTIQLENLTAEGDLAVDAKGEVVVNQKNIGRSTIQLSGDANLGVMKSPFKVQGTIDKPRFSLR